MSSGHESVSAFLLHGSRLPLRNWASTQLSLLWAYEGTPTQISSAEPILSQSAWLLRQGSVRLNWRGQELTLDSGQWLILGSGRRAHTFSDNAKLVSICFRAEWSTGKAMFDDAEPIRLEAGGHPGLEQATARLLKQAHRLDPMHGTKLLHRDATFVDFLTMRKTYFNWLAALSRALQQKGVRLRGLGSSDERLLKGIQLLEEWPLQEAFDEPAIAAAIGLSQGHFTRLFAVELGVSPNEYYNRRRFNAIRERLLIDDAPIKTVAYQFGFHDASHFSNWFRKRTGVSPKKFRAGQARPWVVA